VISMEDWVTIRNLKKRRPDLGTRKIAELLGMSRNTVKRALRSNEYPVYKRKSKINKELKPFFDFIRESYLIKKQKVSVIISNLRSKGFKGSDSSVYRYIKNNLKTERQSGKARVFKPYETLPGEQMLYDWSQYSVNLGGNLTRIYVHITILGYSRYRIYNATLSIKQSDVLDVLEESFHEFGGVCQRIQVDNARVFVDNASANNFKWNSRFLNFCGFYGIKPTRSLPGHPWSKGKVENPFYYLENHFINNTRFDSFEDFYKKLKEFQQQVNNSVHNRLNKKPYEAYLIEKGQLLELPQTKYVGFKEEFRKVTSDCLISYNGNRYSVPHLYARSEVWVRLYKGIYLHVYSKVNKLIAVHKLAPDKGKVIIDKTHYKGYHCKECRETFALSAAKLKNRFNEYNRLDDFILGVKAQKRLNPAYHLYQIRHIFEDYSKQDCITCMEECLKYNVFNFHFVKGYLTDKAKIQLDISNHSINGISFPKVNVKRPLSEYKL